MKRGEAIEIAREVARREKWPWEEPILAVRERSFWFFGRSRWRVMSSADQRGGNINIRVDDATGAVLSKAFARR